MSDEIIIVEHHKKAKEMKQVLHKELFGKVCEFYFDRDYTHDMIRTMLKRNVRVIDSHKVIIMNPKYISRAFYYNYAGPLDIAQDLGNILTKNKIPPMVRTYEC